MNYRKSICKVYNQHQHKPKNGFFISNFLFTKVKKEESIELEEYIKIMYTMEKNIK